MKTIAFYHLKGGVGKTASAVNISYLAANSGMRTLLWDLDPQGSASWYFESEQENKSGKAAKLIGGKVPIGSLIETTRYENLDLIPSHISFRNLDIELEKSNKRKVLETLLKPLSEDYELIVLDCPPSFSKSSEAIFKLADAIIVPLIPSHLSVNTYQKIIDYFDEKGIDTKKLKPFYSMVDRRRSVHQEYLENPPIKLKNRIKGYIPYASVVEKMGVFRQPVNEFANSHPAGLAYRLMWDEVKKLIKRL